MTLVSGVSALSSVYYQEPGTWILGASIRWGTCYTCFQSGSYIPLDIEMQYIFDVPPIMPFCPHALLLSCLAILPASPFLFLLASGL